MLRIISGEAYVVVVALLRVGCFILITSKHPVRI
ncbi:unnamed protein product [Victoria cruziana]